MADESHKRDAAGGEGELVKVTVKGLILDPASNDPIVILREEGGERFLPIWIGIFEANAIALRLEGVNTPRPLSHDLMASIIEGMNSRLERIVVCDLKDSTFFAQLVLRADGRETVIDARPSDAIALALRTQATIFVEADVFDKAQQVELSNRITDEEKIKKWLEEVDPEDLGKYTM
ncbi:MAG: bifunctional nuclease family protein [Acidobacteria bacterium]|nr:MAG: bifunctional nuclease family protein [Acidobacteriota bacterium]